MSKQIIVYVLSLVLSFSVISLAAQTTPPMSKKQVHKWFEKKEWLNGAQLTPHKSIDEQEFARQYQLNKKYWDEAFTFLKEHDLAAMAKGKYPIDEDNVYASVTEDPTKDFDKTNWESHRKYIDLQCIITGDEKMGVYPVAKSTVTKEYDDKKDVANYTAKGKFYEASAGTFFIFFPQSAHRPNITPGGNKIEKKIVIKVRVAGQ